MLKDLQEVNNLTTMPKSNNNNTTKMFSSDGPCSTAFDR